MKRFSLFLILGAVGFVLSWPSASAQQQQKPQNADADASAIRPAAPGVDVDKIVRAFSAKETQFREALNQYGFKRDALVQTIGMGGQVSGEYHRVSTFIFNDRGDRNEKISFFPVSTLDGLQVTNEDIEDLGGIQPFALEASKISLYNFSYVGKEKIDELDLHVFDVAPKVMPKKESERFFQGRVWVDDQDLQIVKVRGKGVPEGKQRFPTFETYREQIDGKYWFPTYTYADEELVFDNGQSIRMRMKVRYTDYQVFRGSVRIIEDDGTPISEQPSEKPNEKPTPKP